MTEPGTGTGGVAGATHKTNKKKKPIASTDGSSKAPAAPAPAPAPVATTVQPSCDADGDGVPDPACAPPGTTSVVIQDAEAAP